LSSLYSYNRPFKEAAMMLIWPTVKISLLYNKSLRVCVCVRVRVRVRVRVCVRVCVCVYMLTSF